RTVASDPRSRILPGWTCCAPPEEVGRESSRLRAGRRSMGPERWTDAGAGRSVVGSWSLVGSSLPVLFAVQVPSLLTDPGVGDAQGVADLVLLIVGRLCGGDARGLGVMPEVRQHLVGHQGRLAGPTRVDGLGTCHLERTFARDLDDQRCQYRRRV